MRVLAKRYIPMFEVPVLPPAQIDEYWVQADRLSNLEQDSYKLQELADGRQSGWNMDTADDRLIEPSTGLEWGAAAGDKPPLIRWKYGPGTSTIPRWEEKGTGGLNIVIADNQSMCLVNANNVSTMNQSLTLTPDDADATIQAGLGNLQIKAAGNIYFINQALEAYYMRMGVSVASPTGMLLDATLHSVRVGFDAGASISSGQSLLFVGSTTEITNDGSAGIQVTSGKTVNLSAARLQVTTGADGSKQGSPLAGEIYASSDKNVLRIAV